MRDQSRRRRRAARRHHGERHRRPRSGRVHPQGARRTRPSASSCAPASPARRRSAAIIVDYDINDYKAKTELTADKLFTALTAALRSYQQLQRMIETRRGLEIIIEAAVDAVRLQVDAAAGGGRADADRVAAQGRAAPASWCCARRRTRTRRSRCWPAPAATAASSAPTSASLIEHDLASPGARGVQPPPARVLGAADRCSTSRP